MHRFRELWAIASGYERKRSLDRDWHAHRRHVCVRAPEPAVTSVAGVGAVQGGAFETRRQAKVGNPRLEHAAVVREQYIGALNDGFRLGSITSLITLVIV